MPSPQYPPFDPDATLEELAGIGKNRRFDQKIDDDEDEEIQVIYKRGDVELPLAKPRAVPSTSEIVSSMIKKRRCSMKRSEQQFLIVKTICGTIRSSAN